MDAVALGLGGAARRITTLSGSVPSSEFECRTRESGDLHGAGWMSGTSMDL